MLVLTIRPGEPLQVGRAQITVLRTGRGGVRVGVTAPRDVEIDRNPKPQQVTK